MKQPELGKKIAELRKAKSLTQEELVKKCNLNVRTLQRIESGVVTPRSYTIKAIFAALEYCMNDTLENMPDTFAGTEHVIPRWLEQIYIYVFDLFNLKTNTMKKISILTVTFAVIGFGLFTMSTEGKAQKKNVSRFIISTNRGIVYLFPRNATFHISNMKDTADYRFGNDLIQEYKHDIFLNKKFFGVANPGDTVVLDNGKITIKWARYWQFTSFKEKKIIYLIPKDLMMDTYYAHMDTDNMVVAGSHIQEYDNKLFLNGKYCGMANAGDSVIFKKGSFFTKSTLSVRKGNSR
jgi:transcriptional regulator with XRE-family HTH domain